MKSSALWRGLRDARYALPGQLGRLVGAPDADRAIALSRHYQARGLTTTIGYFNAPDEGPAEIVAASHALIDKVGPSDGCACHSIKAPALKFDTGAIRDIAQAASRAGMTTMFDAHGHEDADATLNIAAQLLQHGVATGVVLPARWKRSLADAARFRDSAAQVRVVRGEWPDDADSVTGNADTDYVRLVETLAGRHASVALATHRPALFARSADLLREAGTPFILEQLRGLPRGRTSAVAHRSAVPVRLYVAFGPGWIPYAVDRALARPHLPLWFARDWLRLADA